MADMFEEYDSYIGKLNTSDPDKADSFFMKKSKVNIMPSEEEVKKFEQDVGKGFGTALVGTPGDIEMLGRGVSEATQAGQQNIIQTLGTLSKQVGLETVGNIIDKLYSSQQNRSAMEALLEGLQQDTVLPTTQDIQSYLKDKYDVQFDEGGATLLGELLAPGGYIKGAKKGITKVKEMIGK